MLTRNLEQTLHRALSLAGERRHEYATLEHLLLGLAEDNDAVSVLRACDVDLDKLRQNLRHFLDEDLSGLAIDRIQDPKPTEGFQRVVQGAAKKDSNLDEVTGADVLLALFSEHESHAVYFLGLQNMTRLDAINFIVHGRTKGNPPPQLPLQGVGPHVEIDLEGMIAFSPPEALDADGNHLPRLHALHPELRDLASGLTAALKRGNVPHAVLCERIAAYTDLIDRELQEVDFRRLYAAGVRVSNAAHATWQAISAGDLPPLALDAREELDSLIALHGSFILATAAGTEALLDEERYSRRTAEEQRFRTDAVIIAAALRNRPDLVAPNVAEQILGAAQEIGKGANPERSTVAGRATLRNVMISIAGGGVGSVAISHLGPLVAGTASWLGVLAFSETLKKTRWFQRLTASAASTADRIIDAQSEAAIKKFRTGLRRHKTFMLDNETVLFDLARQGKEFEFLDSALRWLNTETRKQPPNNGDE